MEYIETPYGFIGISKTGVERGISKKLKDAVKKDIAASSDAKLQSSVKIAKKEDKVQEEKEPIAKERDELSAIEKKEGVSQIKFLSVALVLGVVLIGYWVLAPGATNAPENLKSTPSPTSKITTAVQTPAVTPTTMAIPTPFPDPASNQKSFTNSIGMDFVLIPSGEFDMGSPSNEIGRWDDEGPVHHEDIAQAFYMGKYEVTQKQWREVMGKNTSYFKGDDLPVEQVSWNDVQEFIKKLNENEGTNKYRLPSEEEWEYAVRAGTNTRYFFGDDESKLSDYAWYDEKFDSKTHPVGQKKPNPWGLYDVYGNVLELVRSKSSGDSSIRVVRGCSSFYQSRYCRSATKNFAPDERFLGFRLVREINVGINQTQNITPTDSILASTADQKFLTSSIGMEFVLIPAGEFDMGSPSNETGRNGNEGPVHHVKISNAFYMGKYEVTQKQWSDVMGTNPSNFKSDNLPVEEVSWNDVQDFIKKFNEKEGANKYRLPTEAEWEYAVRAGTTTRYSFGDDESKISDYAWYSLESTGTHEVGQKNPNPWGLYDMHGNVWEWVQDKWHDDYNGAPTDGSSWESGDGSVPVKRGGSFNYGAGDCRSAHRGFGDNQGHRSSYLGFRLVRVS